MNTAQLSDQELMLLGELINQSQFKGQHIEIVVSLKQKVLTEIKKRQITSIMDDGNVVKKSTRVPPRKKASKRKS